MNILKDPLLLIFVGLLGLTLTTFYTGFLPYPFGLLLLLVFIVARVVYKR